jgi:hypothetical protein
MSISTSSRPSENGPSAASAATLHQASIVLRPECTAQITSREGW